MNYIKYLQNAGTITYANESRMPGYGPGHWYGGLVSGINGSRYSVHPGVYNFYTNEDGSISWGNRTGHIVKGSDGKLYVDFEVDPNLTARPELKTYLRFELGLTALKPQTPVVELDTEQEIINNTLQKVSTSVPILNLTSLNNLQAVILPLKVSNQVPPKSNTVVKLPAQKPVTPKSNSVVKLPVPLNLLPYIANVTSDGVAFFNIPDGYTSKLFEEAVKAVYGQNRGLALKPMVYYEQPQLLILQLKQQLLATLLSLKLYLAQRQQIALLSLAQRLQTTLGLNMKYKTNGLVKTVKVPVEGVNEPDLVTEVFAYPTRKVDVYNIHPEAYLKVLEYLKNNFDKAKTNNKPNSYVLSLSGFDNVPIGGEVNDSIFHYISKDGQHEDMSRWYFQNANIINKNESFLPLEISDNIVTNNGKLKMYSNSNSGNVYYKNSNEHLINHPFTLLAYNSIIDFYDDSSDNEISYLKERGFNELLIKDFINKSKNMLVTEWSDVDKSVFRPIEKELSTLNNSTGNIVLKVKLKAKQAGKKVLSFLGFLNGGTLNYLNYIN